MKPWRLGSLATSVPDKSRGPRSSANNFVKLIVIQDRGGKKEQSLMFSALNSKYPSIDNLAPGLVRNIVQSKTSEIHHFCHFLIAFAEVESLFLMESEET